MLDSLFNSIWPVPIGFLFALLIVMAFFFRKRLFGCLKGKQNNVDSGTYRRNGELDNGLDIPSNADPGTMATSPPASEIIDGQRSRAGEFGEYPLLILPNSSSAIGIFSSPVNDTVSRGSSHGSPRNEQDSVDVEAGEAPPPSYSSLFYCPPPKYEDVVVTAQ